MARAYVLLRCIGKAVVKNVVKNVVNLISFGVGGDILIDAWEAWQEVSKEQQRAGDVEALAAALPAEVAAAAAEIVRQEGAGLSEAEQQAVIEYLKQVPPMIRRSMRRPADPEGRTIRPGATFRKPDDLLPLLPPQAPRFKPGDRPLPGVDWELVELLGRGGFGEVWKARNPHFDGVAPVALKFCLDPAAKDRLLKHEARIINQVMRQGRHDGIVPLQHSYLSADPPCLAYEYVAGGELTGLIQEHAPSGGMGPVPAARIIHRLAEIVGFAHGQTPPIVHRDLKPANILVQAHPGGEPVYRITDFGIGGLATQHARGESRQVSSSAYRTSALLGSYTPHYASRQQMAGDAPDPSDDIYALGVIWYQLLTGNLTNGRPGGDSWKKRLKQRGMAEPMLALLTATFEDERSDRPANGSVLAAQLGAMLDTVNPQQKTVSVPDCENVSSEKQAWSAAEEAGAAEGYEAYLVKHPHGANAQSARRKATVLLRERLIQEPLNKDLRRRYLSVRTPEFRAKDGRFSTVGLLSGVLLALFGLAWIAAGMKTGDWNRPDPLLALLGLPVCVAPVIWYLTWDNARIRAKAGPVPSHIMEHLRGEFY